MVGATRSERFESLLRSSERTVTIAFCDGGFGPTRDSCAAASRYPDAQNNLKDAHASIPEVADQSSAFDAMVSV